MTIAHTDFFGNPDVKPAVLSKRWLHRFLWHALIGLVLVLANFPNFISRLIDGNIGNAAARTALHLPVKIVQSILTLAIGPNPIAFFERAMTCSFVLLFLFIALSMALAIRHKGLRMPVYGFVGIVLGYFALPVIAWAAVAVAGTLSFAIYATKLVYWGLIYALVAVFQFLWPIAATIAAVAILYVTFVNRQVLMAFIKQAWGWIEAHVGHIVGGALIIGLLAVIVPLLVRWVIQPIIMVIAFVVKWAMILFFGTILAAILAVALFTALGLLGSLLVTQLQAGWHAARSVREMLIAGFAIGSGLAVIILVTIASHPLASAVNNAWIAAMPASTQTPDSVLFLTSTLHAVLPAKVETFIFAYLTNFQAPALDSFVFLAVTALATMSILLRLYEKEEMDQQKPPISFVVAEYALMIGGLFVAVTVAFLSAITERNTQSAVADASADFDISV